MPSASTFSMPPVQELLYRYIKPGMAVLDPFAGNSGFGTRTNDLNPMTLAQDHMSANEWLVKVAGEGVLYDVGLIDPPYSARQVQEVYSGIGRWVSQEDTQMRFLTKVRDEISKLIKPGGIVISFGWNSAGLGKQRGFAAVEVLLVAHGGTRNDTIVTVEQKEN